MVDELVAELHGAFRAIDLEVPSEPNDAHVLDEIDKAIAPARLPGAARRLWELVDPSSLQQLVSFYPLLAPPEFGLRMWRENESNEFIGSAPRHFFPVCYESHDVVSVECDGPEWTGGSLFEWFLSDSGGTFKLRYRSVDDWLTVLVAALRDGMFQRVGDNHVMIENQPARELARARLVSTRPDAVYGTADEFDRNPEGWPAAWLDRARLLE